MAYTFFFGDTSSAEIGLKVEGIPDLGTAQRDGELKPMPGKSKDDYIDYGRYKNVEFSMKVALVQKGTKTVRKMIEDVVGAYAYLQGYQWFDDSEHIGFMTEAVLTNFEDFRRDMRRVGKSVMKFSREPFWYSYDGLNYVTVPLIGDIPTQTLTNPYKLTSAPLIEFETQTSFPVELQYSITNDEGVESVFSVIVGQGSSTVVIDCEKEVVKINNYFADIAIPKGFEQGINTFKLLSGKSEVNKIKIMPRWRCL